MHVFEAEVLRKSPGYEIEITRDTQLSIGHAAPSDVSLPAVSSFGGLRTPAPVCAAPLSGGRHPQTFTEPEVMLPPVMHWFGAPAQGRSIIIVAISFLTLHETISCCDPFIPQSSAFACRPRIEVGQPFSGPQYVRGRRAIYGRR